LSNKDMLRGSVGHKIILEKVKFNEYKCKFQHMICQKNIKNSNTLQLEQRTLSR